MSRILVTGAAGFLGSYLCERLLAKGHEVTGRTQNLESIFYEEGFTFHEHDVTEYIHVNGDLDWVVHLASLASPEAYDQHPIKTLKLVHSGRTRRSASRRRRMLATSSC